MPVSTNELGDQSVYQCFLRFFNFTFQHSQEWSVWATVDQFQLVRYTNYTHLLYLSHLMRCDIFHAAVVLFGRISHFQFSKLACAPSWPFSSCSIFFPPTFLRTTQHCSAITVIVVIDALFICPHFRPNYAPIQPQHLRLIYVLTPFYSSPLHLRIMPHSKHTLHLSPLLSFTL